MIGEKERKPVPKKLNLGSGMDYMDGFCNIDKSDVCRSDIKLNLEFGNFPIWWNNKIELIIANNFFVMVKNYRQIMNECHRVLKCEIGVMECINFDAERYPHLFFQDPEHQHGFTRENYNYLVQGHNAYENFGKIYGYEPWKINKIEEIGSCLKVSMTPVKNGQ